MSKKPTLHLIHLKQTFIFDQLQLEEALLRTTCHNWCIFNSGSPPSIVLGISGKPHELLNLTKIKEAPLPLIKRYTGGGTVIVDEETFFVTFIFQKETHSFPLYPEPILKWSEKLYQKALQIPLFALQENDYVVHHQKCGGNAQYIQKNRFVHHTTFLWDFQKDRMEYLLLPKKAPEYRQNRPHADFLCRLKDFLPSKGHFIASLKTHLAHNYQLIETPVSTLRSHLHKHHRQATQFLSLPFEG